MELDNAKHYHVFRLLGRVARTLEGSDKSDRGQVALALSLHEQIALQSMIDDLFFSTVEYLKPLQPIVIVFTDASDDAAGIVFI